MAPLRAHHERRPIEMPKARKTTTRGKRAGAARTARAGWTRADEDKDAGALFGSALRTLREDRNLTLSEVTKATGITAGTLSRIENSKMAPTFAVLLKIMQFFEMEWSDLISRAKLDSKSAAAPFLSAASAESAGGITVQTGTYTFPHGDKHPSPFLPLILEVTASAPKEVGGLVGHPGVEFCYVLDGELHLHVKGRKPVVVQPGGSLFFDSRQPHAYTVRKGKRARLLIVSTATAPTAFLSSIQDLKELRAGQSTGRHSPSAIADRSSRPSSVGLRPKARRRVSMDK